MSTGTAKKNTIIDVKKITLTFLAFYFFLIVAFFFLAGDQLRYRVSRGTIEMPVSDSGTVELVYGASVEQHFKTKIQRFSSVSVQFGTYYRTNSGTVTLELLRAQNGELLMQESFDASEVAEGQILTISSTSPIETVYDVPLILRITADSLTGRGITPLMNSATDTEANSVLFLNGEQIAGKLCFSADGTDYIWAGLHYWKFSIGFGVVIALFFLAVFLRYRSGKHSFVINAIIAVKKYRFLIRQLVSRDFKTKYKRSVLGVLWSFLNPLLMMLVQFFVFSTVFKNNVPNFAAYLIIGTVIFNFFSESCGMTLGSILNNAGLITKVYMPKYIYPLTRTLSSVVNLAISLIPMLIVCLLTGVHFQKSAFLALYFLVCHIIFCLGLGLLLSTSMVFFRDTQFLWNVLSMMWMYATPIFYPETIIPEKFKLVLNINPLYHFLKNTRVCILDGVSPEPAAYFCCLMIALGMLIIGGTIFYKNQDKFVLYL